MRSKWPQRKSSHPIVSVSLYEQSPKHQHITSVTTYATIFDIGMNVGTMIYSVRVLQTNGRLHQGDKGGA